MDNVKISPIFYMGNKKKLIKKNLIKLFPENIDNFIEVFAGSAVVSMNVEANRHIVNDVDSNLFELYNLFKTQNSEDIISHINKRIDEYGLARERTKRNEFDDKDKIEEYKKSYFNLRDYYNKNKNVLDFYTLMFYSFSQQFRFNSKGDFNMPCGNDCFSEGNKEYIRNGCKFFSSDNVYISKSDFRTMNFEALNKNDFVYLDPPYLNTTATYNENGGWTKEDEEELYVFCEELNKRKIKFAMSNVFMNKGVSNEGLINWVNKNDFNVYTFDKFTYMACGRGNSNAKEVLITNY